MESNVKIPGTWPPTLPRPVFVLSRPSWTRTIATGNSLALGSEVAKLGIEWWVRFVASKTFGLIYGIQERRVGIYLRMRPPITERTVVKATMFVMMMMMMVVSMARMISLLRMIARIYVNIFEDGV